MTGRVSGPGKLTFSNRNRNILLFFAPNSFSGGLEVSSDRNYTRASSEGAFGTGDITINNLTSIVIDSALSDTISDSAILYLNGSRSTQVAAKMVLGSDETILALYVDGVRKSGGTYGSTSSTATYQDDTLFSGTGLLTVKNIPGSILRIK